MSNIIKEVKEGDLARQEMLKGIETLYNAVSSTLGPAGRNVVIEKDNGELHITKDGVTVAKNINLEEPLQNLGAQIIKKTSQKVNDEAGDGTTTATVLSYAIIKEGLKQIKIGVNPIELKRGLDKGVEYITKELLSVSKPVDTNEQIKYVAMVSSNNDETIGTLISTAMERVGHNGVIIVEDNNKPDTNLEIVEGFQFDKGYLSQYFINNQMEFKCELVDPLILLYNKKINNVKQIQSVLEQCIAKSKPILIIAEDISGEALPALIINNSRGTIQVCAVQAPSYGTRRNEMLEDIAVLTGGTVIDTDKGMDLAKVDINSLGTTKKVIVTKNSCTIVDGKGSEENIQERITSIKNSIDNASSDYEKEQLQKRLASLVGGIAILNIGAETDMELKEKKDRVEDALNSTKAAIEMGILPGGGLPLYRLAKDVKYKKLTEYKELSIDQKLGFDILIESIKLPFINILQNKGLTPEVIWNEIGKKKDKNLGFDVRNEKYVDMYQVGIIDPVKVTCIALEKAASISGLFLTSNTFIYNVPEDSKTPEHLQQYMN